jgi:hypothetical protein
MTLSVAILNLLDTMPRPVPAEVVAAQLPAFYARPVKLADIARELELLQSTGEVLAQARRHVGMLYSITPSGKAAIA